MRFTPNPVPDGDTNSFLGQELSRIKNALTNAELDSVVISGSLGLTLANNSYINWLNSSGVAPALGIGVNTADDMVIRNAAKNSSNVYIQALDSGGTAQNAAKFTASGAILYYAGSDALGVGSTNTYIKDTVASAPYLAMFNSIGVRQGFFQAAGALSYVANDNTSSMVRLYAKDSGGTVKEFIWDPTGGAVPPAIWGAGKRIANVGDAYLRLNQEGDFASGIFTPGHIRTDAGVYFSSDTGGISGANTLGYTYGSVGVFGIAQSGWYGYNIANRMIFMHDGGSSGGIYNNVNGQWILYAILNGAAHLYHAGVDTVQTATNDLQVTDGTAFRSVHKGPFFKSAQQAVAASGSVAHGLGVIPTGFQGCLVCTTAEKGYSIGDEVDLAGVWQAGGGANPCNVWADATNVGWSTTGATATVYNKAAATFTAIVPGNWRIVLKAWKMY